MSLLGVELRDTLFSKDAFLIPIIVQLFADESVSSLATPVTVWERHLDACKVLSVLQQDCVKEPKTIVEDIFILWVPPPRGP